MCARRFLVVIAILTLLVVAGAFAIYQFGSRILIRQAIPQGHFQAPPPRSGPDYASLDAWIAHPGGDRPADWRPDGVQRSEKPRPAALFYIHPTTYLERDRWNAPLSGHVESDRRASLFVQSQASAFADVAEVWAPRYRQAAYGAFLLKTEDAEKALAVAYSDIASAFDEFLHRNPSGPLILAGHSQGSLHLMRLLTERGPALEGRLVAAYVVGWPVSLTADLPAMGLPPCSAPGQAGCVLSWQSFIEPANPKLILDAWEGTKGPAGGERRREDMVCVNPLTGASGGVAVPPVDNRGAIVPAADLTSARLADSPAARCDKGLLLLSGDVPAMGPFVLPGNNYHVYDYALFWGYIRADAERRLKAFRAR